MHRGLARIVFLAVTPSIAAAQDWPAFRGPNSSGVTTATALPTELQTRHVRWSRVIPFGRSSPIVQDHRVVLTATDAEQLLVLALDTRTGKELWRYSRPRPRHDEIDPTNNDPASSTPVADPSGVYAFFPDFGVVALDRQGKLVWERPLGPFVNNYGMASSPIASRDSVFLQIDQAHGSFLLCLDKRTGAVRWKKDRPSTHEGWSTPILTSGGEVVTLSSNGLEGFDTDTGGSRWLVPAPNAIMIPVPLLDGDRIIATFRGSEQAVFPSWQETLKEMDADGDGRLVPDEVDKTYGRESFGIADPNRDGYITEGEWNTFISRGVGEFGITSLQLSDRRVLWRHKRGLPYVPSPVLYGGKVYSVRTGGILSALDARTGAVGKEGRLPEAGGDYFASLVAADGKLYAASAEGKVTVVKTGEPWEILTTNDLGESIEATPAIADEALFIRTRSRLLCFRKE